MNKFFKYFKLILFKVPFKSASADSDDISHMGGVMGSAG